MKSSSDALTPARHHLLRALLPLETTLPACGDASDSQPTETSSDSSPVYNSCPGNAFCYTLWSLGVLGIRVQPHSGTMAGPAPSLGSVSHRPWDLLPQRTWELCPFLALR